MSAKVLEAPAEDSVRSGLKTSLMRHRCLRSIRRNHRHRRAERDSEFACNERNSRVSAASAMCMKVPVFVLYGPPKKALCAGARGLEREPGRADDTGRRRNKWTGELNTTE